MSSVPIAIYRDSSACSGDRRAVHVTEKRVTAFLSSRRWKHGKWNTDTCLEWTGARTAFGHGRFRVGGRILKAHRVAFAICYGSCPAGLVLLHTCDNPACVRPSHLRPGTVADNNADMRAKGRAKPPPRHAGSTHPNARKIRFRGRSQCVADWAREQGIKPSTVSKRLERGWSVARSLTEGASK
jgi:hypothetical protein